MREFLESRTAPQDNAAPLYFAALADLCPEMDFVYPPAVWQARLPQVQALSERIGNLADEDKLLARAISLEDVQRVLAAARPALEKIDNAQQNTNCVFVTGLSFEALLPHAQSARQIARLAQLQLFYSSSNGDFDETESTARRTLRLSRDLRPRGGLICQLVSIAMDAVVLNAIKNFTLRQPDLKPEHCVRLIALIADHQRLAIEPFGEGVRFEYITMRNALDDFFQGRRQLDKAAFRQSFGKDPPPPNKLSKEKELTVLDQEFATVLAIGARPYHEVLASAWGEQLRNRLKNHVQTGNAVVVPALLPAFNLGLEATARDRARLDGVRCLIAVRRYELTHRRLPDDLQTAVREAGIAEVPMDPYCDQPMRYRIHNSKPIVYSIGSDQKDDGGLVDWNAGQQPGDFVFQIGQ